MENVASQVDFYDKQYQTTMDKNQDNFTFDGLNDNSEIAYKALQSTNEAAKAIDAIKEKCISIVTGHLNPV